MSIGLRKWIIRLSVFVLIVAGVFIATVGRIDRTPLKEQDFYTRMLAKLDTIQPVAYPSKTLSAAWGKVNITPAYPMPLAGYRPRPTFESVHDSLFVRTIIIDNGSVEAILISADLLIFPPTLKKELEAQLTQPNKPTFFYYSATHTHNGLGGWHPAWAAQFVVGDYHANWIESTARAIAAGISKARINLLPAQAWYWQTDAREYAANRLKPDNPYDGELRGLKFSRADSTHAYLVTFSAHATSISKKSKALSGDYPAALVNQIETNKQNFGMFMAGMVGSHRLNGTTQSEYGRAEEVGKILANRAMNSAVEHKLSAEVKTMHVPIEYGTSQLRLTENYKLRNWLFANALQPLQGELTCLQIGSVMLLGTPCDFSGEIYLTKDLEAEATRYKKQLIITSFNGGYTGYITEDAHYETSLREEVTTMNWVGPYFGDYYAEMIKRIVQK
ncbi:MAG: neutral/alkaline non-lysosomal ceramidase N-terminal domain-containing protein [Cyclobacteriaceae bacterium]|nr:neutral/alkaline non-lysosomal ceramidase N-terminal domain-containing protein [Cyclobacteriaceae bacterium]